MPDHPLIERYLDHLRAGFGIEPAHGGVTLVTPFFTSDHDAIEVFVGERGADGSRLLSDRGETVRHLSGICADVLASPEEYRRLELLVRANQASLVGDEIQVSVMEDDELPAALDRLIQTLREAGGLRMLDRTPTASRASASGRRRAHRASDADPAPPASDAGELFSPPTPKQHAHP